jgi:hypothetical protein
VSFSGVSTWFDAHRIIALFDVHRTFYFAPAHDWLVLTAAPAHDWLVVTAVVEPVEPDPLELVEPDPELVEPEPEPEPEPVEPLVWEVPAVLAAVAFVAVLLALDAASAGSCPVTSCVKMTAHSARKSAVAIATTVLRILRMRRRRALRRALASALASRAEGPVRCRACSGGGPPAGYGRGIAWSGVNICGSWGVGLHDKDRPRS